MMRRVTVPPAITHKDVLNDKNVPVVVSFHDWLFTFVLADVEWGTGNNVEANAKLDVCDILQTKFEDCKEGDVIELTEAEHEIFSTIVRAKNRLMQLLQTKEKKFIRAVVGAKAADTSDLKALPASM